MTIYNEYLSGPIIDEGAPDYDLPERPWLTLMIDGPADDIATFGAALIDDTVGRPQTVLALLCRARHDAMRVVGPRQGQFLFRVPLAGTGPLDDLFAGLAAEFTRRWPTSHLIALAGAFGGRLTHEVLVVGAGNQVRYSAHVLGPGHDFVVFTAKQGQPFGALTARGFHGAAISADWDDFAQMVDTGDLLISFDATEPMQSAFCDWSVTLAKREAGIWWVAD